MKKYLYSLALVLMGMVSCTTFDDPTTEHYGAAPGIDINIAPGAQTDSSVIIKITPEAGALYYAYIIDQNDEAEQLDSAVLYKGGYGNAVVKAADQPTTTITIDDADPNTTYQVYAVAGSDKGIIGSVVVKSITTTDRFRPDPGAFAQVADQKGVQIAFSEVITRGTGAVTGKYYKEWDWDNPVTLTADEIEVEISKTIVQLTAPNTPDGAFVTFAWEEGAFVDAKGNKCAAFTTTYDEEEDDFIGFWVQNKKVAFEIADLCLTPVSGTPIGDWQEFKGTITLPFNIYRNDESVKQGDVQVVYINGNRMVDYNLNADQWAVEGDKLTFGLPTEPTIGDLVSVIINEGVITDVYGNPNSEYSSANVILKYAGFIPTKEMLLGTFELVYYSYYSEDGSASSLGTITIEENPAKENGLIIKNMYNEGSAIEATYDLEKGTVSIADDQSLGQFTDEDGTWDTYFYTAQSGVSEVTFNINKDGSLTSSNYWGIYVYNAADPTVKGWMDVATTTSLVPVKASARKTAASAKSAKTMKMHKSARYLKKQTRK